MFRRSFLKTMLAAPVALPAAAKAIAESNAASIAGEAAFAPYYSVAIHPSEYIGGVNIVSGGITSDSGVMGGFTVRADRCVIVQPDEVPIGKFLVEERDGVHQIVLNPAFTHADAVHWMGG